ncbi:aspartyl/asparaginyl beta-hydroxylase-like [Acipenser ruthenus]|uniref:aspartyl/asparaginyl beta-hydroxylase-like n=1 Tax=Acipenser ruthenus TaxID=7906 RepID=UPI002741682C|nr:aspartyl/asparaginyl beta-hydroxylase-like [Acipenser ruthenus]
MQKLQDDLAEKQWGNEALQRAIRTYGEVAEVPNAPTDLVKLALRRRAERQQFLVNACALVTFKKLVQLFPDDVSLKNDLSVGYLLLGDNKSDKRVYEEEGLESGDPGTDEGRFDFHLGDALQRVGDKDAYKWHEIGHQRGHFASVWQQSLYNVDRLKAQAWWTAKETGYTDLVKIKYSVMQPGTHIWPHTGPTNCHL